MMHRIRKSLDKGRGAVQPSTDANAVQIKEVGTSVVRSPWDFRGPGLWKLANAGD